MKYFQIDKEIAKIYLFWGEGKYEERTKLKILTSSETRGMDFLRGRHSRSVLMSLKKGLAPGGPDCVAPVFSWAQILFQYYTLLKKTSSQSNQSANLLSEHSHKSKFICCGKKQNIKIEIELCFHQLGTESNGHSDENGRR